MAKQGQNYLKPKRLYRLIKRLCDIILAFIALVFLALPLIIVAIIVKCNSKGPALFKDKRVGYKGKMVTVYKFRSMYSDAEANIDKYLTPEQKETWIRERKLENDPRITKVGRFIRKTSIDELPQFINVLFGTMSLVGPRPISKREYETHYTDEEKKLLNLVKPGITGYWQVYGRNDVEFETGERQKLELEYVYKRSLWLDTKIVFLTVPAVLSHKGVKQ